MGRVWASVNCPPLLPVIVRLFVPLALSCGFEESVTVSVKFVVPAVVGVPLTTQLFGARDRPAGSGVDGSTEQVYGAVPPVTPIVALYGVFTVPFGRGPDKTSGPPPLPPPRRIVRVIGPVVLCCGFEVSVAFTVMFEVPAAVGVPLTRQPVGVSVNPAGRTPDVMVQV